MKARGARARPLGRHYLQGRETKKVDPSPTALSTRMLPVHHLTQSLANHQAKPGSAVFTRGRGVYLAERAKQAIHARREECRYPCRAQQTEVPPRVPSSSLADRLRTTSPDSVNFTALLSRFTMNLPDAGNIAYNGCGYARRNHIRQFQAPFLRRGWKANPLPFRCTRARRKD